MLRKSVCSGPSSSSRNITQLTKFPPIKRLRSQRVVLAMTSKAPPQQMEEEETAAAAAAAAPEETQEQDHDQEKNGGVSQEQPPTSQDPETKDMATSEAKVKTAATGANKHTRINATPREHKDETAEGAAASSSPDKDEPMDNCAASTTTETAPGPALAAATKRKLNAQEPQSASVEDKDHGKTKKARSQVHTESVGTTTTRPVKTKTAFAFARPTASSARRTAAVAQNQAQVKATPVMRKMVQSKKRAPAEEAQRLSTPVATRTSDKAARAHFSYTPYTGPLPPLTVESSFAPKNGQGLDRGMRSASPAQSKVAAAARKSRPASAKKSTLSGKENCGVHTEDVAASSSQASIEPSRTG
uniref:Uncharacterized protein n=1 Tax=Peronospora matthiolae TaxID=2874970 RepID=A0AAV1SXI0_9STRA